MMRTRGIEVLTLLPLLALPLVLAPAASALPGDIEFVFAAPPAASSSIEVLDVDGEGKILALAMISNLERRLLRYLPNGSLDPTFQEPVELGGRTRTAAILSDNTIIAAGNYLLDGEVVGAVHLLGDGSRDVYAGVLCYSGGMGH